MFSSPCRDAQWFKDWQDWQSLPVVEKCNGLTATFKTVNELNFHCMGFIIANLNVTLKLSYPDKK